MTKTKPVVITLIIIIGILIIYAFASGNNTAKKIKSLSHRIEHTVDSLNDVKTQYDSLYEAYESVERQLLTTRDNVKQFRHELDSILALRVTSVSRLNTALDEAIHRQDSIEKLDSINNNFRFD